MTDPAAISVGSTLHTTTAGGKLTSTVMTTETETTDNPTPEDA